MLLDWTLASLHHLAAFALAGILAFEFGVTAQAVDAAAIGRLARVDAGYGIVAGDIVVIGVLRVLFGAKWPAYYMANAFLWTKMGLFVAVGRRPRCGARSPTRSDRRYSRSRRSSFR
jgi:putative membrane protein